LVYFEKKPKDPMEIPKGVYPMCFLQETKSVKDKPKDLEVIFSHTTLYLRFASPFAQINWRDTLNALGSHYRAELERHRREGKAWEGFEGYKRKQIDPKVMLEVLPHRNREVLAQDRLNKLTDLVNSWNLHIKDFLKSDQWTYSHVFIATATLSKLNNPDQQSTNKPIGRNDFGSQKKVSVLLVSAKSFVSYFNVRFLVTLLSTES